MPTTSAISAISAVLAVVVAVLCPPVHPHPVTVSFDGSFAWVFVNRLTGQTTASTNADTFTSTTESLIKPWIVADYLRRAGNPPKTRLAELSAMIRDSDDDAAEDIFRLDGRDQVTRRLSTTCGLTGVTIRPYWWSYTTMSATTAARMGQCLADGRAAGTWTDWLLAQMRAVRGDLTAQTSTTGGGRWGIIDGLPPQVGQFTAIKNGWTVQGGEWHVNCLAIHPAFILTIMTRFPYRRGLAHGAELCAQVTRQMTDKPSRTRFQ